MYEGIMELGRQSTVYNFNFNNLLILLALKLLVLIVMSGGLGVGFLGRSLEAGNEMSWVEGNDLLFMTTYLVSDGIERYDCLNRLACLDDHKAQQLLTAAMMMIKGAKYLRPFMGFSLQKYEQVAMGVEEAIYYRREGGSCRARYQCQAIPSL
ncbi:uncharacterized protein LOC121868188 [Homarus americanus]|uniref:uncharacterized protein LOC121868188 n=1 Tax=Homarus americanus TaxID=6706 RepID=UPI001C46EA1B|nr:uncharacterized protein LOC121868188 [Homarus americanus]